MLARHPTELYWARAATQTAASLAYVALKTIELDREQLRETRLFLATPMYGGACSGHFASCALELRLSAIASESLSRFHSYTTSPLCNEPAIT